MIMLRMLARAGWRNVQVCRGQGYDVMGLVDGYAVDAVVVDFVWLWWSLPR